MRKFENIKPLSQVSYRKREIPEYQIGGFFKTVAKPFIQLGTWTKGLFNTIGQSTDTTTATNTTSKPTSNTTSKPASVETTVKTSTSNVTTQGSPTKSATSNIGVNQNVSSTSTQSTSVKASTIPVPPSTEEVAISNLTKQSNPDNAVSTTQTTQTTQDAKQEKIKQSATDTGQQVADATKQIKDTIKNKDLTGGQKFRGIAKAGAGIVGAVGSLAADIINPGQQTNLTSDTNINAGMDIAANVASQFGPYGQLAAAGIKGLQTVGNFVAGNMKPKFSVDKDLQARQRASYMDTFKQVEKLSQGPGIMGIFGGGWRDKWQDAQAQYELTKDIDDRGQDAAAASRYEGIGLQNQMALNGGYTSLRAAKNGMKINSLKFARKAASGLRFNSFKMQQGEGINLTNKNINPNDLQNPEDELTKAIREAGGINYTDNAGNTHVRVASNLLKTYKPSEIQEWYTKNHPQITVDWNLHSSSGIEDADLLNDEWWNKNKEVILQNADKWWKSEDVKADNSSEIERIVAKMSDLNYQLTSEEENILTKAGYKKGTDGLWYDPSKLESKKQGGVFTFFPATEDEEIQFFKEGGSFNVIPDGALHKNKHHIEDTEGLTQKGIPVVTEGVEGKLVQQAEIEINEIIFRLEVTNKLEELAKEGTDEAAIEAGKLLVKEILHNTHDNTGLIDEISI